MPIVNTIAGFRRLRQTTASTFLRGLWADLVTLCEPDLPLAAPIPRYEHYPDAAAYAAAVASISRQWCFRVVRQAVRKAQIRETVWARLGVAYSLFGFVLVPLWMLIILARIEWLLGAAK